MVKLEFCRICTKLANTNKLFEKNKNVIIKQIAELTGLFLKNSKQLPQHICIPCQQDLDQAHAFRERCIFAQKYFETVDYKELLTDAATSNELPSSTSLKINDEIPMEEDYTTEVCFVKMEASDVFEDAHNSDTSSSCNDVSNDILDVKETEADDERAIVKVDAEVMIKPKERKAVTRQRKADLHVPKLAKPKGVRKRRKANDKQAFICDQCGNHFTCKHHFLTHLQRHTGDKQFHCELCPDKFFTYSELNRHMRRHTGERPFPCKHCGRRFTDYSSRIKHERTHTNERPFACTQCDKAFTTSYILKNHMLVHTGERSFQCNQCNKSFQRHQHLVVHNRSLIHQQNEEKQQQQQKEIPWDVLT